MPSVIMNKRVVVAGGAGFLGSHLVNHLIDDRNCEVLVLDNLCSGKKEFIHPRAKFEPHDITWDERITLSLVKDFKADYAFNYAASPYIPVSYDRPMYVCNVNAFGAMKFINACHEAGVKGILQVSSAEIYGEQTARIDEQGTVKPHSSYGASKAMVDFYVQARWKEAKTPCVALRQFNCVGERETHPYVIPEIISQLYRWDPKSSPSPVVTLGNNSQRDFMYAGDAVKVAVELLESGAWGEVFNLGSEESIQIYKLAELIGNLCGFGKVTIKEDPKRYRPWEIWFLQSNNKKAEKHTTFRPGVTLTEAIARTVNDFLRNGKKWCWEK
jgi:nucleoside-diphosphate-sugar epimerase